MDGGKQSGETRVGGLLVLVVVALPVIKATMLVGAPFVDGFEETGDRSGFYCFWIAYLLLEIVLVSLVVRQRGVRDLGSRFAVTSVARALGVGLVVLVTMILAARSTGAFAVHDTGDLYNLQGAADLPQLLFLLGAVLVAVLCEEVLFRWFAVTELVRHGASPVTAVCLPAIGFGLLHLDVTLLGLVSAAWTGLGGALLGVIFLRTRSLGWPILLHAGVIAAIVALAPARIG